MQGHQADSRNPKDSGHFVTPFLGNPFVQRHDLGITNTRYVCNLLGPLELQLGNPVFIKTAMAAKKKKAAQKPPDPKALEIGGRIRQAYTRAGMTRAQFVRMAEVSYMQCFRWEKGEALPGADSLAAIAGATNVSVGWLLGEEADTEIKNEGPNAKQSKAAQKAIDDYIKSPYGTELSVRDKQDLRGFAWHALGDDPPDIIEIHDMLRVMQRRREGKEKRKNLARKKKS